MKGIWDLFKHIKLRQRKHFLNSIPSPVEFRTILEQERAQTDRLGYEFSLLLFHLGNGEDRPAIAERLSQVLKRRVRLSDKVGWWNEEEIGVILTGTFAEGALKFAHEIRRKVAPASDLTYRVYSYPTQWFHREEGHPEEGMERFFVRRMSIWKRGIDIAGSIIGLFLFSPVMLAAGIAIKLNSPGPIIFKQERVGWLGKKFTFLKFRSMYVNGNSDLHKAYIQEFVRSNTPERGDQERHSIYKIKDDPRVTFVGKFLRKASLDELPQLINVLKGEMSLVGPRPPIRYECEHYDHWHKWRIHHLKPGMTGLWQVKGRSRTTFDEMVRLDLKYIREWSLWLDIKILIQTPSAVLSGKGAY